MNTNRKTTSTKTKLALAIAAITMASGAWAAEVTNTLTANLTLTSACEVSPTATIDFGSNVALDSVSDATANTGSTFQVACSEDATPPTIYADATRTMTGVGDSDVISFNLSLTSGAASDDLASVSGSAVTVGALTQDGAFHDVVIYGKAINNDTWGTYASELYTGTVQVTIIY